MEFQYLSKNKTYGKYRVCVGLTLFPALRLQTIHIRLYVCGEFHFVNFINRNALANTLYNSAFKCVIWNKRLCA